MPSLSYSFKSGILTLSINSKEYKELWLFAQTVAKAMEKVIRCERISIVVIGLEVPHAHIHLIPIDKLDDMNFAKPKLQLDHLELAEIAERIIKA